MDPSLPRGRRSPRRSLAEAEAAATKVEDGGGAAAAGITASGGIGEGGAAAVALGAEGGACPPPLPPPLPPPPVLLRCAAAEVVRRRRPAEPRAPAQDPSGPYHGRDRTTRPSQDAPSPPRSPAADSKEPQPMPPALPRSLHSCASSCSLATASSASSSLSLSSTSFTCVLPAPSLSASDLAPHPATTTMPATQNAPSATDPSAPAAKPSAATTSTSYTSATPAFALPATRASGAMSTLSPASSSTSAFAQPATPSAAASTSAGPAAAVASTTAAEVADLVSVGFSLIAMGHENTSGAAAWALTLLAAHPGSQRRLRAELESELGLSGAAVTDGSMAGAVRSPYVYGALARLPYLGAVVQEALRLFPPVPVLSRQSAGPAGARAGGCDVRPGEELLVSPYVLHRLPGLWDRPHEFRPERFLERASGSGSGNGDSGCSSEGPDSVNGRIGGGGYGGEATTEAWRRGPFMAFGSGPRTCIGAAFGLAEVKLLVAHVILRYDMDLVDQDLMRQMDLHDGGPGRGSGPGAGRPEGTGLSGGGGQVYAGAVRDGPGAGGLPQRLFVSLRPAQGLGVRFRPRSHTS
ncbi:hypothetical protein HYH03_013254 [Edaphochlamys debaryana]|uniref:Cytochrome P450 n=1 Tax=Edaphochlamys debaryana TaxID=47281 RepID=A0A835XYQ5_9CHLO|nr:hypothetical protein HYH03_013254 [Edaphochlamys debaryana]|eukprot:KAG2488104.1 hypothetical protein HYH03_013254 [Edaphochlamys debaryana]